LVEKADMNNTDWWQWPGRTREYHMKAAEAWRDAPNKAERDKVFRAYGIRWSALLLLDYFDPTKMVVVDSMHNLFLGLVQHHFRVLLGIDCGMIKKKKKKGKPGVKSPNKV
jgi:hypothetical protein